MRDLFLVLNIPRLIPFIICYFINKSKIEKDLECFINYGKERRKRNKLVSMLHLLLYNKEYRNVFLLRQKFLVKKLLGLFCFPLSSLYIETPDSKIMEGLLIVHGFSTIINAEKIGNNCTIYQQCTIGYGNGG